VEDCTKPFKPSHIRRRMEAKAASKTANKLRPRALIRQPRANMKGKDMKGFRPTPSPTQLYPQQWLEEFDNDKVSVLQSAKLMAVMDHVRYWRKRAPDDKIIIFSQFKHFQILLGVMLEEEEISFLYFSVSVSTTFQSNDPNVLLGRHVCKPT